MKGVQTWQGRKFCKKWGLNAWKMRGKMGGMAWEGT